MSLHEFPFPLARRAIFPNVVLPRDRAVGASSRALAWSACTVLLAVLGGVCRADAQPVAAGAVPGAAPGGTVQPLQGTEPTLSLTLEEAVRRAIDHNPDLVIVRLDPQISAAATEQAQSAFRPLLATTLAGTGSTTPPSSSFLGSEGIDSNAWFGSAGVRQRLQLGGGTWHVSWDAGHTSTSSPIATYDPNIDSSLLLAFSQPLLRDRAVDPARYQVAIARQNESVSDLRFKEAVVQTVASVKLAYWDLKAAIANVGVQQRSLDLALELARQSTARVDVGELPPLDQVAAEAEVATRREGVIRARTLARDAEDRLRRLIMDPADRAFWQTRIDPADEPPAGAPLPDAEAAVRTALDGRLDVQRARQDVETASTTVRFYDNQRLPDLRVEASVRPTGLGGTRLVRDGFPGTVIGRDRSGLGNVLEQLTSFEYPSWTFGLTLSYPIGVSYEEAALTRATLDRQRAEARVASLELQTIEQIRTALRQVESTAERIDATRAGADLARQRVDAEQKRFEVGMSTSFLVTQAQRDLVQAEVALLQAMLDHQSARIGFETLQQAPALNGPVTIGLSGSTVVALPPSTPRGLSRTLVSAAF